MELVERQTQQDELAAALRNAEAGVGRMVLVTGESGAGKTALVRQFAASAGGLVVWGLCDGLITPRPLGPLRDIIAQLGGDAGDGSSVVLLDAVVSELDRAQQPMVVVIEDAHWADAATLDAVRFLGRRVARMAVLVIVTFRDAEVSRDHPLRRALGGIPPDDIQRIYVPPLSRAGVAQLASRDDIDDLYRLTGGNPFYITEVLASQGDEVPHSVQDAVMARVGQLSPVSRACVETAAVLPGRAERWLLGACEIADGIDEAAGFGLLQADREHIAYSHELVRQAVERSLAPARRRALNRQVLDVLAEHGVEPARLAHHAVEADDSAAVSVYAPVAARRAAALDSHREAVAHFTQALRVSDVFEAPELAGVLYDYAYECYLTERHDLAENALEKAAKLFENDDDHERLGMSLAMLSEVQWYLGRGKKARETSTQATAILENEPAGLALAWAYAQNARLAMVDRRSTDAVGWGNKAIALARSIGDAELQAHALNTVGSASWCLPPYDNSLLLESLQLSLAHRLTGAAGRAYANLVDGYLHHFDYAAARRFLDEGIPFCDTHDLVTPHDWLLIHRAALHLEVGRWAEAESDAQRGQTAAASGRLQAMITTGLLHTRRGEPDAQAILDAAQAEADRAGDAQDLVPVGLARLELRWLQGDSADISALADEVFELAQQTDSRRWIGEAALWLHRAGRLVAVPRSALEPYALQISGQHREAARIWADIGRPYARAEALADATDAETLLDVLESLHQLGAGPLAASVRRRLAALGAARIPRGPRAAARSSPAGLTARQTEVLSLLAEGLTYEQIAARLHLSVKTVDHHASAVRTKLDASTRDEAVDAGRRLGILTSG